MSAGKNARELLLDREKKKCYSGRHKDTGRKAVIRKGAGAEMEPLVDFIILLDGRMTVQRVEWKRHIFPQPQEALADKWIGKSLTDLPDTDWNLPENLLVWMGCRFAIDRYAPAENIQCILARREEQREKLLESALDAISDSVQIYDRDLRVVYYNLVFRKMMDLSDDVDMRGKKLLNIFDVDENYSTTIEALRTKQIVRGRYDNYKSTTGKNLQTVNAAFPVIRDGRLLGAVSVERNMKTTKRLLAELNDDQRILAAHQAPAVHARGELRYVLDDLIGSSQRFTAAVELARKMAGSESGILLQGETGTGKEIFAQGIHALSRRCNKNFVAVNCAAIPESLIEGTLFGTVKGAFTGSEDKAGLLEEADHGTLFLDEVNSMSLSMQAKLLRVLQEGKLRRVGGTRETPVDVRVISSCNEDAYGLMESGKLRRDIFYRLASIMIEIPPLRERGEDIEELVRHYLAEKPVVEIEQGVWDRLHAHKWPGNVRELFYILDYALNVCEGGVLRERDLPPYFSAAQDAAAPETDGPQKTAEELRRSGYAAGLSALRADHERRTIEGAFAACGGNLTKTAELLKISRQNLQHYLKKYGIK